MKFSMETRKLGKLGKKLLKRGKKLSAKHPYGILFTALTLVTVMVGLNEYLIRENDRFLAEFNAPQPAMSDNMQYAEQKEDRELAGKQNRFPRK